VGSFSEPWPSLLGGSRGSCRELVAASLLLILLYLEGHEVLAAINALTAAMKLGPQRTETHFNLGLAPKANRSETKHIASREIMRPAVMKIDRTADPPAAVSSDSPLRAVLQAAYGLGRRRSHGSCHDPHRIQGLMALRS
jgi:hypothetical protein